MVDDYQNACFRLLILNAEMPPDHPSMPTLGSHGWLKLSSHLTSIRKRLASRTSKLAAVYLVPDSTTSICHTLAPPLRTEAPHHIHSAPLLHSVRRIEGEKHDPRSPWTETRGRRTNFTAGGCPSITNPPSASLGTDFNVSTGRGRRMTRADFYASF